MSNTKLTCHFCGGGISRPQENWGHWWDSPTCLSCYLELSAMSDHEQQESWYGLAPHIHDLTLTGSFIGSTVMTPLPALTGSEVDLGWGWFVPDEDAPGMGIYTPYGSNETADGGQLNMTAELTAEASDQYAEWLTVSAARAAAQS